MIYRRLIILSLLLSLCTLVRAQGHEDFDMKFLKLELSADNLSTKIAGKSHLVFEITSDNVAKIKLELIDELSISGITINSVSTSFTRNNDIVTIDVGSPNNGDLLNMVVSYSGEPNPASNGIFAGINNDSSNAWGNQVTWTLSEPFNAKYWWPAKQDLNDKIDSIRVHITTGDHLKVGSNGLLQKTVSLTNNRVRYEWASRYPIAYYLVAFTIGEYVEYNNYAYPDELNGDSILIQNYIYNNPETLPYYRNQLDEVPEMMELFSTYFGLYPFHEEKYGHVMAPFSGGMEHQTMSSMGIFTFGLNAHELGHQWFGDHITCATWSDIWINEGFARFCEYFAAEKLLSKRNGFALVEDDILSVTGTEDGSVYVPESESTNDNRIFNFRLTYAKGGLIVNMIREIINNDDLFFKAIRAYLTEYGNGTATGADFKAVIERETGKDYGPFFDQWYYGEGHPVFDITWFKASSDTLEVRVKQQTTSVIELFTTPLEFKITYESGQVKLFRLVQTTNEQTFKVPASGKVEKLVFDPDGWLIKKVNSFNQIDENGKAILSEPKTTQLLVYPNPGNGNLNFSKPLSNIEIFDAAGKKVLTHEATTNHLKSGLQPGMYLLKAEANGRVISTQVVIK
ncbi:MAG: M1 family aminopeptidase [Marinoscillum sp.]